MSLLVHIMHFRKHFGTSIFIEAQGYTVGHTIIYQENKSSILLEVNVKLSSSKYTKHIKTRYFSKKT